MKALHLFALGILLTGYGPAVAQNLLANPNFDGAPAGWTSIWARDPNGATAAVVADHPASLTGMRAVKVVSTGARDWSFAQTTPIPVHAGDILVISGWLKSSGAGEAEIGLHTADAAGNTLDWSAGVIEAGGTHDWQPFTRKYVVPSGCATVQYRLTGYGPETCLLAAPSLTRAGNVGALVSRWRGKVYTLSTPPLGVRFNPATGALALIDRSGPRVWWQAQDLSSVVVKSVDPVSSRELRADVWDVVNDLTYTVDINVGTSFGTPAVTLALSGSGPMHAPAAFPHPFQTQPGDSLVVPLNAGILYPVDDPSIDPIRLPTYQGNSMSMPWVGIEDAAGAGVLTLLQTPDDADFDIARHNLLQVQPLWEPSKDTFSYRRKLTYAVFAKGGYVAQAKWYRRYARARGLFRTLAEKRRANPNVDKLIGAANIWTWDADKAALCRKLKSLGMDHVLWSGGGSPAEVAEINRIGFLTSRYDIYQDVWPPSAPDYLHKEGWPDDLVLLQNGDWMKGWADITTDQSGKQTVYQGGVINSARGLARAEREIPEDLRTTPYTCRFLDTTTASPWREDYSPVHPLTRSQDRRNKLALLDFCSREMKLVTGSETGIDAAVPSVDYFEGMLSLTSYRLADAGRNMLPPEPPTPEILKFQVGPKYRIPLWELVYHDCVVSYWYWGDYNNKILDVWPQRDLFDILYAEPPMYMFDRDLWSKEMARIVDSDQRITPVARRLGYDEMLSHAFLTPDHTLQETVWSSGARVLVNFGSTAQTAGGIDVPALGYRVVEGRSSH